MRKQEGFTLMELIITIAVLGILGAIAVLSSQGMLENYRVRGATRQIYSDMQLARLGAIKGGRDWAICFSPGNQAFTSYSIRNTPGPDNNLCTEDDPTSGSPPFYSKSVNISGEYPTVTFEENFSGTNVEFSPNGTASSGNVTIRSGTRTLQVTVSGNTGNIRIQ